MPKFLSAYFPQYIFFNTFMKKFVSRILEFVIYVVFWVIRNIPRSMFGFFASFLVSIFRPFAREEFRKIYCNTNKLYGKYPFGRRSSLFAKQVMRHQVVSAMEIVRASYSPDILKVSGRKELGSLLQSFPDGQGIVGITGHVGSWDLSAAFIVSEGSRNFSALAKPAQFPVITGILEDLRNRFGANVIWTDSRSVLKEMLKVIKSGNILGFVMDQKPDGRVGPIVNFFGYKTAFVAGPAKMAIRTGCPVIAVFCVREGPWRYRILSRELLGSNHGVKDEVLATQIMASEIERIINLYPEQWVWNYKRWRFDKPWVEHH